MNNKKQEIDFNDRNLFYKYFEGEMKYRPYFRDMMLPLKDILVVLSFVFLIFLFIGASFDMMILGSISGVFTILFMSLFCFKYDKYYKKIFWKHFTIRRDK